ncbi:MAG: iron-containing alcohol dehydrogenase [Chloroflexi bacterium]|nr:iron-containing alcohol dehydrogenase [Chloroflexota bacterium]
MNSQHRKATTALTTDSQIARDTVFAIDSSSIHFGPGVTREVGFEMRRLGARRVMVVTDPRLKDSRAVGLTLDSLRAEGIEAILYDRVEVEPTDISFKDAIAFAIEGDFDGYVAVGGGSSIDTCKAANLYATYPADFLAYVNAPIGEGRLAAGPLKPMIAIPTTAGTGSETTGGAIFDLLEMKAKTGISDRAIRPTIGLVDPDNTGTMPRMVAACSGFDVLCHGLESYTALPFSEREAPADPGKRPAYQGANPISDVWAISALEMVAQNIVPAVNDPSDDAARSNMMLAATFAGVGFGNAGVHLAHGMSYPVSGMVTEYLPDGYPEGHPMVPHGMGVVLCAPAVFRYTAPTNPERHLRCAQLLGADTSGAGLEDAGELLAAAIVGYIRELGLPNGLSGVGYTVEDVDALVAGTLPQHRVTKLSPRPVDEASLRQLFLDSMTLW